MGTGIRRGLPRAQGSALALPTHHPPENEQLPAGHAEDVTTGTDQPLGGGEPDTKAPPGRAGAKRKQVHWTPGSG